MQHMTNVPNHGQPIDVTNYLKFVYVIDGEVAQVVRIPPEAEMMVAIMQSKPLILEVDPKADVDYGYIYDGESFHPPAEEN